MAEDESDHALARIEAALSRIEAASMRLPGDNGDHHGDLAKRHERLREAALRAMRELDTLIAERAS